MVISLKPGSKGFLQIDKFKASGEFRACTPKQQVFILKVIESDGDYTKATLDAYGSKNARQAQVFSYAVRDVDRVKAALNLYLGKTPIDVLLDEVERNLRRAEKGSVAASRLLAQKERLILGEAPVRDDGSETARPTAPQDTRVPAGCRPVRSKTTGELLGYLTPDGQRVALNFFEVAK